MTKLGVNPPAEGAADEKKDIEKDPKIFTVVQPCPQMVPVQMPPIIEGRKRHSGLCGTVLCVALISTLLALFAFALVVAFSGHDGFRSLWGDQERTVILMPSAEKLSFQDQLKQQPQQNDKELRVIGIDAEDLMDGGDSDEDDDSEMQIAIIAVPETSSEEKELKEEIAAQQGQDEGITGNDESVPDEEKHGENAPQVIEGGNTPADFGNAVAMRRQYVDRMERLQRMSWALFQQQAMRQMIARAMEQALSQQDEQSEIQEHEQRLARWNQMRMARLQQLRAEQAQAWFQQQQAWNNQRPSVEFWPQQQQQQQQMDPQMMMQQQQQEQQRWAAYWEGQRRQQMEAEMQRRQWAQYQWAQQQQAAQAEAESRAREQEERMRAWQQAQWQNQQMQQAQMAQQAQQQMMAQQQMQAQAQQQQQQQQQQQPGPAIPTVEDRVYQHFQQLAQNFNSGAGFRPTFTAIHAENAEQQQRTDEIYNDMLRKAQAEREKAEPTTTTTAAPVEKTTEPVVIEDSFPKLNEAKTVDGGDDKTEGTSDESESVPEEEKVDPLAEFFKFFESEAQKMAEQPTQFAAEPEKKDESSIPTPAPLAVGNAEVDAAEPHLVENTKAAQTEDSAQTSEPEPPKSAADLGNPKDDDLVMEFPEKDEDEASEENQKQDSEETTTPEEEEEEKTEDDDEHAESSNEEPTGFFLGFNME